MTTIPDSPLRGPEPLYLFGAGVRARLVVELIDWQLRDRFAVAGLFDDFQPAGSAVFGQHLVLGNFAAGLQRLQSSGGQAFVATGTRRSIMRCKVYAQLRGLRIAAPPLLPPDTRLAPSSSIGGSSLLMPGTFVGPATTIGSLFCAHGGAVIEHDCRIRHNVMLGPGVSIAGGCTIGDCTFLGAGVTVAPNVKIGSGVLVGAGSVVLHDLPPHVVAFGSPARVQREVRQGDEVPAEAEFGMLSTQEWELLDAA